MVNAGLSVASAGLRFRLLSGFGVLEGDGRAACGPGATENRRRGGREGTAEPGFSGIFRDLPGRQRIGAGPLQVHA